MIAAYQDELRAIAERLQDLAGRLASCPSASAATNAQLTRAHICIVHAIKNARDAERSGALARHAADIAAPLDAAA